MDHKLVYEIQLIMFELLSEELYNDLRNKPGGVVKWYHSGLQNRFSWFESGHPCIFS